MRTFPLLASTAAVTAVVLSGCATQQAADQRGPSSPTTGASSESSGEGTLHLLAENMARKSAEKSSTHMVFRADAAGMSVEGAGDVRLGADPAMQLTLTLPGQGTLDMRLVEDVFYVKLPEEVEPGKPWVRVDTNGNDPLSRALGNSLRQMKDNGDPSRLLRQLEDAGEITGSTTEELNGQPTTHYSITIDATKAANAAGLEGMLDEVRKAGIDQFPLELWVDQEDLPVRMAMEIPVRDPSTQQSTTVRINVDYSDWGKPVDVTAPSPAEVAEIPR